MTGASNQGHVACESESHGSEGEWGICGRETSDLCEPLEPVPVQLGLDAFAPAIASQYAWYQIDQSSLPLLAHIDPVLRRKYLKLGLLPGPRRYELGRFRVHEQHLAIVEAVPALEMAGCIEVFESSDDSSNNAELQANDSSPLLRFLELADKADPVPQILVDLDDTSDDESVVRLLRDRDLVESLDPVGGQQSPFELQAAPDAANAAAPVPTCFQGGFTDFANAYCSNWGISYCDKVAQLHRVRTTGSSKRKHSFTRVASCGGITSVYHFWRGYYFGWKWFVASKPFEPDQQLIGSGDVKAKHFRGIKKRRRKVEITSLTSSYFRAYTSFHN